MQSTTPDLVKITYPPFGNRCSRCGGHFDDGGMCQCGLDIADPSILVTREEAQRLIQQRDNTTAPPPRPSVRQPSHINRLSVEHRQVGPTRCSCGGIIGEMDTVCTNGGMIFN